jgi:hypothetical protein
MLIAWLVLSGRWDVFGTPDEGLPIEKFFGSLALFGLEVWAEFHWILEVLT